MSVTLRWPGPKLAGELAKAISEGGAVAGLVHLDSGSADRVKLRGRWLAWSERTEALLDQAFETTGFLASGPRGDFTAPAVPIMDLRLIAALEIPGERLADLERIILEQVRVLAALAERLDLFEVSNEQQSSQTGKPPTSVDAPIFLVHGHDLSTRETVRRFLEQVSGRRVIVLQEQPGRGASLLDKLLSSATPAAFCVVLVTGDDEGRAAASDGQLKPRARQNVVFELGLFLGLLGRDRVVALYEPTVELPSDYQGVDWLPLEGSAWQLPLGRELSAADIAVNLNKAM